jgi:8-oxo-dGTP diphosphatase
MRREIREELGIEVQALAPLLRLEHRYPEKTVLLDTWRVLRWAGEPHGAEGQPLRWLLPAQMDPADFPPADIPIIRALQLPPLYLISPDLADERELAAFVQRAQAGAATLLQVRLRARPLLAPALVAQLRAALPAARILLNSDTLAALPAAADLHGADGVHLTAAALRQATHKPAPLCGASCHDATELALARALGLDFATLSPVQATATHLQAVPLGWPRFAALAAGAGLPVYALGGMRRAQLDEAVAQGAIGLAGISGLV